MGLRTETELTDRKSGLQIPRHVAIIMDGNGRWAQQQGLPRLAGHRAGVDNIRPVLELPQRVRRHLRHYLRLLHRELEAPPGRGGRPDGILQEVIHQETLALHDRGVRILHLGRADRLTPRLQEAVAYAQELTKDNRAITLSVAFNYGGRAEILEAVKRVLADRIAPEDLDEALFSKYLYTAHLPDPDLIIRTGGELRLSNFLLWQSAYSEYYPTDTLWPDLGEEDVAQAIQSFSRRKRRFGTIQPEDYPG